MPHLWLLYMQRLTLTQNNTSVIWNFREIYETSRIVTFFHRLVRFRRCYNASYWFVPCRGVIYAVWTLVMDLADRQLYGKPTVALFQDFLRASTSVLFCLVCKRLQRFCFPWQFVASLRALFENSRSVIEFYNIL